MATYHLSIKSGKRGKAVEHSAYIAREGKHGKGDKKNDLVETWHGNMPEWANDSPAEFWRKADKHERINGTAYREFELAIPNELTRNQQRELVDEFIKYEVGEKPFQAAIHAPTAAIGDVEQPHAHIIISDRVPDGIDRSPEQHFKRYNPRTPDKGGARKDSGGREPAVLKEEVRATRKKWADQQNIILGKYGHEERVDYRSNEDRGIDVKPERHLGSAGVKNMTPEKKLQYLKKRQSQQSASA